MKHEQLNTWSRKAESWERVTADEKANHYAKGLPVYPITDYPCQSFPEERPQYHVERSFGGERFLIDTQGYDYARYAIRLVPPCGLLDGLLALAADVAAMDNFIILPEVIDGLKERAEALLARAADEA